MRKKKWDFSVMRIRIRPKHWSFGVGALHPQRAGDGRDGAGDQHDGDHDQAGIYIVESSKDAVNSSKLNP